MAAVGRGWAPGLPHRSRWQVCPHRCLQTVPDCPEIPQPIPAQHDRWHAYGSPGGIAVRSRKPRKDRELGDGMCNWDFSSSRQEIPLPWAGPRGCLLEANQRDHAKCPCGTRQSRSRPISSGCRDISGIYPPNAQSAQCDSGGSRTLPRERGRCHDGALALRHRRVPDELEVEEPAEAGSSANEETAEEEGLATSEDYSRSNSCWTGCSARWSGMIRRPCWRLSPGRAEPGNLHKAASLFSTSSRRS
jgi:hypothetical protein